MLLSFNRGMLLKGMYADMLPVQVEEYEKVFLEPGALTAALNWYRQMGASLESSRDITPELHTPTLFIWGNNDPAAGRAAVEGQKKYLKGPYREIELNEGHWLLERHSEEIIAVVLEHLSVLNH